MKVLCTDLDNTIIYSYKHDIGSDKKNVELYHGREISYISGMTYELLKKTAQEMLIIPTSTRTQEQYNRIDLGTGSFKYALVCNGGLLLVDGKRDADWYEKSLRLVEPSNSDLEKAFKMLEIEPRRIFELRFIEKLFIFTKCNEPEKVVGKLKEQLNRKYVDVFHNGEKIYVVPVQLSKGSAVKRLRRYLKPEFIIAAGDSEFDISMVEAADYGLVPYHFKQKYGINCNIYEMDKDRLFSEALLERCLQICHAEIS